MAGRGASEDPKTAALREARCLNPHPERVKDPAFLNEEFFDARDTVQVKYEMVRRVVVDGEPVTATAAAFGYSRPSYYQAAAALEQSGLEGLVPAKPGPREGHKLTDEICAWAEQQLTANPVPLEYWVMWSELRLCGVVVFIDHARHDGSSPDGPQVCEIGRVPGRQRFQCRLDRGLCW